MQRLVLALIAVAILVALMAGALVAIRRMLGAETSGTTLPVSTTATGTQKIAFALLCGLMLYVAFAGPA